MSGITTDFQVSKRYGGCAVARADRCGLNSTQPTEFVESIHLTARELLVKSAPAMQEKPSKETLELLFGWIEIIQNAPIPIGPERE